MICEWYGEMLQSRGVRVVTMPTTEPITLAMAYRHLRLDAEGSPPTHPDDDWLTDIGIPAAREYCESFLGRALAPQVIELTLGAFPDSLRYWSTWPWGYYGGAYSGPYAVELPMSPVVGIESIIYTDGDGVETTLEASSYTPDLKSEPAKVYPVYGSSWPATQGVPNAVTIRYHAGYTLESGSPNDYPLPRSYRAAMLLVLGHLFENREDSIVKDSMMEIPNGAAALMERGRLRLSMA